MANPVFLFRNLQQINMFPVRIKVAYIKYHAFGVPQFSVSTYVI